MSKSARPRASRRAFMTGGGASVLAQLLPYKTMAASGVTIQTHHDLAGPFSIGTHPSAPNEIEGWGFPNNALSASLKTFYPRPDSASIEFCRWLHVWNDEQNVQARLVAFNNLNRPITSSTFDEIGFLDVDSHNGPSVRSVDVTRNFKEMVFNARYHAQGYRHVGFQIKQKNPLGRWPKIYQSTLEIVWKV